MKTMVALVFSTFLFPSIMIAGTATQTDWSGGAGILGPVIDWGNEFYTGTGIDCYNSPSSILIQKTIALIPIEHTVDGDFDAAASVYSADVNGDGYMDVLGAALYADDITWWENADGTGTSWTEHTVDGDFDGALSVYSADVNGDGYMDVLGAALYADDITWWENVDGSGTSWTEHTVDGDFDSARSVFSADVNGDGYMDVLGAANQPDDITWWENLDGSGTSWTEHTIDGDFDGAFSVFSVDVNGDGYMDVMGAAYNAKDITWWENLDGSGTSWTEHIVEGYFDGACSVFSADVNGDGYMDVLGAAFHAIDITWWDPRPLFTSNGSLESSVLDVQESPSWQTIDWTSTEPTGTSVAFQVRASDNSSNMGAWSDTLTSSCTLSGILTDEDNYFQYRAILTTTDSLSTPTLQDVSVGWQLFTGTQEESEIEISAFALYGASPNPVVGTAVLGFSLPVDSQVELIVYDLSGRTVHSINGEYESGVHEVVLDDLACGVYVARMTSEEFTASQQFVVIK